MAWQAFTKTDYRDVLTKLAAFATSSHVENPTINSGGTGYTVGDVLTIAHASAVLTATIEVLTVSAGVITSIKLRNWGAYAQRAASAVVSAGGTGYAVNDVLEVQGGTNTEKAKFKVATLSGSAVATVTLFETGGAYTVTPSNPATTVKVGPAAGSGTGATLTVTYQAIVGTVGIAGTGGTGTGATFNFSLVVTGWTSLRNRNNFTFNAITDEKEVILRGTVTGGDEPYCIFRTWTKTVASVTNFGMILAMATAFNDSLSTDAQPGLFRTATPATTGCSLVPTFNVSSLAWMSVTPRRMLGAVKAVGGATTSYCQYHVGLLNPFGTAVENPYPAFVSGSTANNDIFPDGGGSQVTGLSEMNRQSITVGSPAVIRRLGDAAVVDVFNSTGFTYTAVQDGANTVYPHGETRNFTGTLVEVTSGDGVVTWFNGITLHSSGAATRLLLPTPMTGGNLFLMIPLALVSAPNTTVGGQTFDVDLMGEIHDAFFIPGTQSDLSPITPEDTVTVAGERFRIIPCAHRREQGSWVAFAER